MATRRRDARRDTARREASLAWLSRYDALWDDPQAFRAALEAPPPVDLLVPPGGERPEAVRGALESRGLAVSAFGWAPWHLRVDTTAGSGTLPEVVLGQAFPQGVVSSLPPRLLDPGPGELILDACAAPGGKTLLLARLAGRTTRLVASDLIGGRTGMLVQILARHGIDQAVVIRQDASQMPHAATFDRILLDAPCSGEGTFRVPKMRFEPSGEAGLARAAGTQRRLLERALHLLAPGGRLAWATCTYAPEENEAVLTRALAERPDVDVLPLPDDVPGLPGIAAWHDARFDSRLSRARRLGPHHTGSWGFFVALLAKDAGAEPPRRPARYDAPQPPADDPEARRVAAGYLEERFGVPADALDDVLIAFRGTDIWALSRTTSPRGDVDLARLHVVAPGMRVVRCGRRGPRATTAALRAYGAHVTRNVIDASADAILASLDDTRGRPAIDAAGADDGQVAIRCGGRVVSGGHARRGECHAELPRAWR